MYEGWEDNEFATIVCGICDNCQHNFDNIDEKSVLYRQAWEFI